MAYTRNDLTRLIEFSLRHSCNTAVKTFPMFESSQILYIYSLSPSFRRRLLQERTDDDWLPKQFRNPEQAEKMAEIATDPSNR